MYDPVIYTYTDVYTGRPVLITVTDVYTGRPVLITVTDVYSVNMCIYDCYGHMITIYTDMCNRIMYVHLYFIFVLNIQLLLILICIV